MNKQSKSNMEWQRGRRLSKDCCKTDKGSLLRIIKYEKAGIKFECRREADSWKGHFFVGNAPQWSTNPGATCFWQAVEDAWQRFNADLETVFE